MTGRIGICAAIARTVKPCSPRASPGCGGTSTGVEPRLPAMSRVVTCTRYVPGGAGRPSTSPFQSTARLPTGTRSEATSTGSPPSVRKIRTRAATRRETAPRRKVMVPGAGPTICSGRISRTRGRGGSVSTNMVRGGTTDRASRRTVTRTR